MKIFRDAISMKSGRHVAVQPHKSGRDRAYDPGYKRVGGATVNPKTSDGIEHRATPGPRRCHCNAWVAVADLNAHYKAHLRGEIRMVVEIRN